MPDIRPSLPTPQAAPTPPTQFALLLCGPAFAGKSTIAARLARELAAEVIRVPDSDEAESLGPGTASRQALRAAAVQGRHVVVDAKLPLRQQREVWRDFVRLLGLRPLLVAVATGEGEIWQRFRAAVREGHAGVPSEAALQRQLDRFEWPELDELPVRLAHPEQLEVLVAYVRQRVLAGSPA